MNKRSKMVYVKSFGCSANVADGEVIVGCIKSAGYDVINNPENADFLVYNTCAVKAQIENRIIDLLKKTPKNKKLIVTGCLPSINFDRLVNEVEFDGIFGPSPGKEIIKVLSQVNSGRRVIKVNETSSPKLFLPRVPVNPVISIIPINSVCLGNCSYCCVRFARGKLKSTSIEEVIKRIEQDLISGFKEFWLTSQDTACFVKDIGTNLAELIKPGSGCESSGSFGSFETTEDAADSLRQYLTNRQSDRDVTETVIQPNSQKPPVPDNVPLLLPVKGLNIREC